MRRRVGIPAHVPNENRAPLQQASKQPHTVACEESTLRSEAAAGRGRLDGVDKEAGADEDECEQRDAHAYVQDKIRLDCWVSHATRLARYAVPLKCWGPLTLRHKGAVYWR